MKKNKKESWRIVVFIAAVAFIIYMLVSKNIINNVSNSDIIPLLITTTIVSLIKIGVITLAIILIKKILDKIKELLKNNKKDMQN